MNFTFLDFIFFAVVTVSAVLSYYGGFVSESLAVAAWVGTAFITKYAYPLVQPKFASLLGADNMFSAVAAYVSVFVAIIMLLSYLNKWLAAKLRKTHFNSVDRSLGFFFGLVRGVLLMALLYMAILWFMPEQRSRPTWMTDARSRSVLRISSMFICTLLPDGRDFDELKRLVRQDATGAETATFERLARPAVEADAGTISAEHGYRESEIRDLERQLQQLEQMELDF